MKTDENSNPYAKNENKGIVNKENETVLKREQKAKKAGLATGVVTTAFIAVIILIAAVIYGNSLFNREQAKQVSLLVEQKHAFDNLLTARDSLLSEWMLTFDEIEKDLNTVKEKENVITLKSSDREFSKDKKEQILKDIDYINSLLDQNKKKIASLTAQLNKSGGTIKGLQVKISELEASIKMRESEISDLKVALVNKDFEIDQLNSAMTEQQVALAKMDEELNNRTLEMDKAFVATGSYKALKEMGLVSKEGGFLGLIGRKESMTNNFSDSSFSKIDITDTRIIPVNSKEAKLITEHPADSYEMIRGDDKKIAYLEITNPNQFWKISKYAVLETKN